MITNLSVVKMENCLSHNVGAGSVKGHVDSNNNNNNNSCSSSSTSSSTSTNSNNISTSTNNNNGTNNNCSINNNSNSSSSSSSTCSSPSSTSHLVQEVDEEHSRFPELDTKASSTCGGKYQLRPRSLQARRHSDSEWSLQDTLRHKPRPQPLSRYRRKTANARERYRMRQINTAFESLRGVLPSWVCSRRAAADMTKITTLRLASAYIRSLQDILDGNAPEDTCSWVLSSILGDTTKSKGAQPEPVKTQNTPVSTQQEADFVSFLCNSSDTGVFQDNLDSLSYLSPMSETEAVALLLGSDPPRGWGDAHHTQLVT